MTKRRITIIGTGFIGASLGLTLQAVVGDEVEIIGHDKYPEISQQAKQLGAVDRVSFNLDLALQGAGIVIIAVPLAEMRGVLVDMGRLLAPDAELIVTDTAPLKVPVLRWADELLPPGARFVGGDLFLAPEKGETEWLRLQGVEHARAELLEDAVYAITARPDDDADAIKAVDNLARHAGAQVLYTTPLEHDVARLFTTALPELAATALLQTTTENPGWNDIRQAAGYEYAAATAPAT
ncbi:MAG: prephenate dehydrogenase/arogenate dehydrogenase family protein, partial [Chloroflexota bacterium]|nr:prephenate dehydrogenase/arogenate dehydrogenase family protein [Chloroflexota bacterium]